MYSLLLNSYKKLFLNPFPVPPAHEESPKEYREALANAKASLRFAKNKVHLQIEGTIFLKKNDVLHYKVCPDDGVLTDTKKWKRLSVKAQQLALEKRLRPSVLVKVRTQITKVVELVLSISNREQFNARICLEPLSDSLIPLTAALTKVSILLATERARVCGSLEQVATNNAIQLSNYPESFPLASSMTRRFIAILGPTNSGKTHLALDALNKAKTGVYLAPLRLLAVETYDRMVQEGVAVSLITGELKILHETATHVASTAEMLDVTKSVDVAVIDEIQLLGSPDRGAAWTAAVCGVPAKEVYLVGALEAQSAIEALSVRLGVPLEIRILQRKSNLTMAPHPVEKLTCLKKGDALITFSRKDALRWKDLLKKSGFSVAVIYGKLSPDVRRKQAALFREGKADIIVATDAIGMGLNLPITRIVFTSATQFNGTDLQPLSIAMTHQIAGRAGRYGLVAEGLIAGFDALTHKRISNLLQKTPEPLANTRFHVAPSLSQLELLSELLGTTSIHVLLTHFIEVTENDDHFFVPSIPSDQFVRAEALDGLPLALADKYLMMMVPISLESPNLLKQWLDWSACLTSSETGLMQPLNNVSELTLDALEDACASYAAYAWLGFRRPEKFPALATAKQLAQEIEEHISFMLKRLAPEQGTSSKTRFVSSAKP